MSRIEQAIRQEVAAGRRALIPYLTAGFPDLGATPDLLLSLADAGADVIELGVPFSDPIADGPTIQKACTKALEAGCTTRAVLEYVRQFRKLRSTPVVLFGAYNPFLHYGMEKFCTEAAEAGVNGLLLPDLPADEGEEVRPIARAHDLDLVFLVAPTTPPDRQAKISALSTGFVYYISLKGVTGARAAVSEDMIAPVNSLRSVSPVPVAVGFGISTPDQARLVGSVAEGVIVGSALINTVEHAEPAVRAKAAGEFLATLKSAVADLGPLAAPAPSAS
jgi:tryptophan synthase alpha chain